ncbi:unnamed protein product, partial [Darwinula stevensoni]
PALQLIVCLLLLEITCFLRESFHYLPPTGGVGAKGGGHGTGAAAAPHGTLARPTPGDRRWSAALTHSSAQSLQSIGGDSHAGGSVDRKISFVVQEAEDESLGSTTTLANEEGGDARRRISGSRISVPRRSGGLGGLQASFKRRSFRLRRSRHERKNSDCEGGAGVKRSDSVRFQRKVSTMSDRSDVSEDLDGAGSGGEDKESMAGDYLSGPGPGQGSGASPSGESPSDTEPDDSFYSRHFPWIKVYGEEIAEESLGFAGSIRGDRRKEKEKEKEKGHRPGARTESSSLSSPVRSLASTLSRRESTGRSVKLKWVE